MRWLERMFSVLFVHSKRESVNRENILISDVTQEMWYILFDHSCLFIQVYMFVVDCTVT